MTKLLQGGRKVRRKAHNLEIGGSSPLPALTFPQGGHARNLLNAEERQGRSADPFLLANGFFEMSHFSLTYRLESA